MGNEQSVRQSTTNQPTKIDIDRGNQDFGGTKTPVDKRSSSL